MVWNPTFISYDTVTVMEETGIPHEMAASQSVHEFYTPQLQRPFLINVYFLPSVLRKHKFSLMMEIFKEPGWPY